MPARPGDPAFVLMLANRPGGRLRPRERDARPGRDRGGDIALTLTIAHALATREAAPPPPRTDTEGVLAERHMARLGGELFSRHLVAIEVAGVLLFAALVGAVAIVVHSRSRVGDVGTAAAPHRSPATDGPSAAAAKPPTGVSPSCSGVRPAEELPMNETSLLHGTLAAGSLVVRIGSRLPGPPPIVMFLAVEMMLQGISISFVAWADIDN